MTKIAFHRCAKCNVSFRDERKFEAHACVKELENVSLDELMRRYNAGER